MKGLFIFSTKFRFYLTEIPPIILLIISIKYNSSLDTTFKLYPLIIALIAAIAVIFAYFFRGVKLTLEDVRTVGLFTDKEHVIFSDGDRLVITPKAKGKIKIELFGKSSSENKLYDWQKDEDIVEINIYRAVVIGGNRSVKRILAHFGLEKDAIESAMGSDSFAFENELMNIKAQINNALPEYEVKEYIISMKIPAKDEAAVTE